MKRFHNIKFQYLYWKYMKIQRKPISIFEKTSDPQAESFRIFVQNVNFHKVQSPAIFVKNLARLFFAKRPLSAYGR